MSTRPQDRFQAALDSLSANGWEQTAETFLSLWRSDTSNMRFGLMAGAGLLETRHREDGIALLSVLADQNPIIRIAQYQNNIPAPLRKASHAADIAIRKAFTDVQSEAIAAVGTDAAGRIATAVWPQTHHGVLPYPPEAASPGFLGPKPYVFYAPDLPGTAVFQNSVAPWADALAAHTESIRGEFLALMKDENMGAPYVPAASPFGEDWNALKGQKTWNAVHLFQNGVPQEAAAQCPKTVAALSRVPLVLQNGNPMELFFSVLKPQTTIPPHFGLANCRVTVHLPLIIPNDCAIRVADVTHAWQAGEPFIFDDSFDHSAWNGSETDMRVVLIFEAWRPDMSEGEIAAATSSYHARNVYLESRAKRVKALLSG